MRAVRCEHLGPPSGLQVREIPVASPGPGDVLVQVQAASLNFPDVLLVQGRYQIRAEPPFTSGSEFSGVVSELGPGVTSVRVGDRVTGAVLTGAFAEQVVCPASALSDVAPGLDPIQAAASSVTFRTAYHALVTIGAMRSGDHVVVLGASGGVGSACLEIAVRLGAHVTAVVSSDERAAWCLERGAESAVVHTHEDVKERLKLVTSGGADVIIDPVGGALAEPALRAIRWGGRYVVVGFAAGDIPRIPLNLVLLKGAILRGFELRTLPHLLSDEYESGRKALDQLVAQGLTPPVTDVIALDEVPAALERMEKRLVLGKVVVDLSR